jgi:hypothetical protein
MLDLDLQRDEQVDAVVLSEDYRAGSASFRPTKKAVELRLFG